MRRALVAVTMCCTLAIALLSSAQPAYPATRSPLLRLQGGCRVTVTSFSFGGFSPLTHAGRFAQGLVTFKCPAGIQDIELNAQGGGGFGARHMTADGDPRATITYNIYLDVNHTVLFGDGTGGSSAYVPGANVSAGSFPIYGKIENAPASMHIGNYSDTIGVTVNLAP